MNEPVNEQFAETNANHIIRCDELTVHYGNRPALEGVSLGIPRNKITAVIGPSGCGKSSFLSALNRMTDFVGDCRVSGRVQFEDVDILSSRVDLIELRRRIGMIFQAPNPFPLSIKKNIQLPLVEKGIRDRDKIQEITENVLKDVGLWDETKNRLGQSAQSLSGGQQQRLCIARALALQPEVLLFDEPCSALDPIASAVVEDLIHELKKQTTVIIVTHNIGQARRIADRVAMFWFEQGAGRLVECRDAPQFFANPQNPITAAYLEGSRG